jgi:hypothetical protein
MKAPRLLLTLSMTGLLVLSCAPRMTRDQLEKKYGPHSPVVVKYGASEKVAAGQPWRVFVAARDPDGDMAQIRFEIKQPGKGLYPVHWKKLAPDMAKIFSGYFYLNTPAVTPSTGLDLLFITLELRCKIYDKAGHASEEITVPFELVTSRIRQSVPAGFDEDEARSLGPIMIRLRSEPNMTGTGFQP